MQAGDIIWVNLPKTTGSVQCGCRPCVILGNQKACASSSVVTVTPITSRIEKTNKIPTHIMISGLKRKSFILPEQIRTVSKDCLCGEPVYSLSSKEKKEVWDAVATQLGL